MLWVRHLFIHSMARAYRAHQLPYQLPVLTGPNRDHDAKHQVDSWCAIDSIDEVRHKVNESVSITTNFAKTWRTSEDSDGETLDKLLHDHANRF